jgi:hypothetical protein
VRNGIQQSGIVGAALVQEVRVGANLIFLILYAFGRDPVARRILAGEKLPKVMGLWQILLAAGWPNVYYAVSVGRLNFSALPTTWLFAQRKRALRTLDNWSDELVAGCLGPSRKWDAESGPSNAGFQEL